MNWWLIGLGLFIFFVVSWGSGFEAGRDTEEIIKLKELAHKQGWIWHEGGRWLKSTKGGKKNG